MSNELVRGEAAASPFFLSELPVDGVLFIPTIADADVHAVGVTEELTGVGRDAIPDERNRRQRERGNLRVIAGEGCNCDIGGEFRRSAEAINGTG